MTITEFNETTPVHSIVEEESSVFISVKAFISDMESIAGRPLCATAEWQNLKAADTELTELFKKAGRIKNDMWGKLILGHAFGEALAKAFKQWIIRNHPSEDDLNELHKEALRMNGIFDGVVEELEEYQEAA